MLGIINPDGGELGVAESITPFDEFPLKVIEAAIFLREVAAICRKRSFETKKILKYAIQLHSATPAHKIKMMLNFMRLPQGVEWFESDGQKLFQMRGPSGGIVSSLICYLVCDPMKVEISEANTGDAVSCLATYGQQQATDALTAKDRDQYQFWQGWCAALSRIDAEKKD